MMAMLRRVLVVLVPLWVALFAALGVPLAANMAQQETQAVYLDRLSDTVRFASLADDVLRRGHPSALSAEIHQYDDVYGIAVAVFAIDGRLLMSSRPDFETDSPAITAGLTTAFAGYRNESVGTSWPWQRDPMVIVEPIGRDTGVVGAVVTVSPTDSLRSAVLDRWRDLAALGALPFVLAILVSVRLAWWVLRPVRDLDHATVAIASGRLEARAATVTGPPELRRFASSFNVMVDTVTRTLRRQRTFVADASHQLRNPLASLRLAVDNLEAHLRPQGRELHAVAQAEVEEMGNVVDNLLSLTNVETVGPAPVPQPVAPMLRAHTTRWKHLADSVGMELDIELPQEELATYAPQDALGNLMDELLTNACRLSGGSKVGVSAALSNGDVVLSLLDDGVGLTKEDLLQAGNRFWRSGAHVDVPGTGLGLAICREMVAAWGGRLTLHPVDPQGLEVRICLPAAGPDPL
jgi:signal transduction histidine kinase